MEEIVVFLGLNLIISTCFLAVAMFKSILIRIVRNLDAITSMITLLKV